MSTNQSSHTRHSNEEYLLLPQLFEALTTHKIRYCHWKSNNRLKEDLHLGNELDLLIHRDDASRFESLLIKLDFFEMRVPIWHCPLGMAHFIALEPITGQILHLHTYYQIITGGSLLKNHTFSIEEALLSRMTSISGVAVPPPEIELCLFVVRKFLEYGSLLEHLFTYREEVDIRRELEWLLDKADIQEANNVCQEIFDIKENVLSDYITVLQNKSARLKKFLLGKRLHQRLKKHAIRNPIWVSAQRLKSFILAIRNKFHRRQPSTFPKYGGRMIAFVGGEASGKSSSVATIEEWISEFFPAIRVHSGKPPATAVTLLPRMLLPILRRIFYKHRTNVIELNESSNSKNHNDTPSLLYLIRSAMIAYDQSRLLTASYAKSRMGYIVICDRFPSKTLGGMDGPRVEFTMIDEKYRLRRAIAKLESKLYERIPNPDHIFKLTVPVEVAVNRNRLRVKTGGAEPEEYVRSRHALMHKWNIPNVPITEIDSNVDKTQMQIELKKRVWSIITGK